jgi:hypothetical protein
MGFAIQAPLTSASLTRSNLRRRLTTAYGCSVLRRRQRPTTTAAYYDDGIVVRRWQATAGTRHDKGDSVDGRQRHNGIGLYRRETTAAAEIDDDAIGGSISLVRGSKQHSTDDRGEETATTIQRPMGDGGGEIQKSALILGGGGTVVGA